MLLLFDEGSTRSVPAPIWVNSHVRRSSGYVTDEPYLHLSGPVIGKRNFKEINHSPPTEAGP